MGGGGNEVLDHRWVVAALLGALAACWIFLTPPGAGADEPSHFVRAGVLATGDIDVLATVDLPRLTTHVLPAEYAVPEPGCYAWQPTVPVDCAVGTEAVPGDDGRVLVAMTTGEYPIWGHLLPAFGTWLPGDGGIWAARLASAAAAVALVTAAWVVARSESVWGPAAVLVALTPMAWSIFGTVNPSAFATAGAVALWVCLLARRPGWLLAAGWAALALPRRDGLIWACLILAAVVVVSGRDVLTVLGRRRGPLALIGASTLVVLVWDVTNANRVAQLGALAPLAVAAAWVLRWLWDRWEGRQGARTALVAAAAAAGGVAVAAAFVARPGGWNGELAGKVVGETRRHLTEAIGVLGWLDAPLPRWSVLAWVALVGVLVALAVHRRVWPMLGLAGGTLVLAVVTSWMFELQQGNETGRYWQGRYSLPLLVGIPLALALTHRPDPHPNSAAGRVTESGTIPAAEFEGAAVLGAGALLLLNVAAWSATRRWAVGIDGTYRPWKWGAELMPVHPLPILAAHAAASAGLAWLLLTAGGNGRRVAHPRRSRHSVVSRRGARANGRDGCRVTALRSYRDIHRLRRHSTTEAGRLRADPVQDQRFVPEAS
ncbi:MAG TPA: DUF2142 domain-containing protein [Ilumatobacter sp.]|nr:DUF2142 domain-containing protein [Ilumatobacter sp.]